MKVLRLMGVFLATASLALGLPGAHAQKGKSKLSGSKSAAVAKQSAEAGTKPAASEDPLAGRAFGTKSAPITIETFSDFQCPACKHLYQTTMPELMENYVNTGKVYLVHRNFPLAMHAHSREAAQYAAAGARIGRYEKVEEALFAKQSLWEKDGSVDAVVAAVLTPAEMAKLRKIVNAGGLDEGITADLERGRRFAVTQTPTMIVMHRGQTYPVVSAVTYTLLRQFLDQLLKQ